jgi:predicted nuclease with TOPRIM domain
LHFGFIANDVETLFPNLVSNAGADPEIRRGLNYEEIIPLLVLMVQEQEKALSNQQAIIQQLQVENAQLRSQLQTLSEQVQALSNRHITGMK